MPVRHFPWALTIKKEILTFYAALFKKPLSLFLDMLFKQLAAAIFHDSLSQSGLSYLSFYTFKQSA